MNSVTDFPELADPAPAAAPQATAVAPVDLKRVDLQAVALAQFGDWRADAAAAHENLSTVVLDLTIPARIAEAKSLRQRLINAPIADARAVSKALKSKLTAVSKAVGVEEEAAVAAYTEAGKLITPKIEAAEQAIEDARRAREEAEAKRIADLKLAVDAKLAIWLDRCAEDGMTAARVQSGITVLGQQTMPAEFADVAAYWTDCVGATSRAMESRRLELAQQELEAAQAKVRAEQERVSGIQRRIAEIQAAATGHDKASSGDLAEAIMAVDALAITAAIYAEFLPLAQAAQANTALTLGRLYDEATAREQREAEEAAERARLAAIAAMPPAPPPKCELSDPGVTAPDAQEGVAQNPLQPEPTNLSVGDLAADGAGDGLQPAETPPTPAADSVIGNPPFGADDAPLETSEAEARPYTPSPFYDTPAVPAATDPRDEFVALVMTAFDCKFPSHPKPSQEWWTKVLAAGLALQVRA